MTVFLVLLAKVIVGFRSRCPPTSGRPARPDASCRRRIGPGSRTRRQRQRARTASNLWEGLLGDYRSSGPRADGDDIRSRRKKTEPERIIHDRVRDATARSVLARSCFHGGSCRVRSADRSSEVVSPLTRSRTRRWPRTSVQDRLLRGVAQRPPPAVAGRPGTRPVTRAGGSRPDGGPFLLPLHPPLLGRESGWGRRRVGVLGSSQRIRSSIAPRVAPRVRSDLPSSWRLALNASWSISGGRASR